jgi:ubiquinone/menaquinone biosynthesis C-methylase UbiE
MTTIAAPDPISYLDDAAGTDAGAGYKRRLLRALDVRAGDTVVDIGCGPGTDLAALVAATGAGKPAESSPAESSPAESRPAAGGLVIGVDRDPAMLAEAARRVPAARVRLGDAHALPLAAGSADRARTDRVLQHVADPSAAVAEARRVLRPGGVLGMAEPDWDTLAVADDDVETSRGFARFTAGRVRNATLGRQLVRLAGRAGFAIRSVEAVPIVFRDFATADRILGLTRNCGRAVEAAQLREDVAAAWLARLAEPPFLASVTLYLVTAARPA